MYIYIHIHVYDDDKSPLNRSKRLLDRPSCPAAHATTCLLGWVLSHASASSAVPSPVAQKAQLYQPARRTYSCPLVYTHMYVCMYVMHLYIMY